MKKLLFLLVMFTGSVIGHEMVPTYPEWKPSTIPGYPGILQTDITLFNKRNDVEYYEIGVFDKDWNPIFFVADYKVIKLKHLATATITVSIAKENKPKVEYICSRSKIRKEPIPRTAVASKICSRFKKK